MNEELDSQLSAMFDNELPQAECELLARRLSRDEELKARWSRYAAISATLRAEGGVKLNSQLAVRVSQVVALEPQAAVVPVAALATSQGSALQTRAASATNRRGSTPRWWMPVGSVAVAASVAAAAILWVRYDSPTAAVQVAQNNETVIAPVLAPSRNGAAVTAGMSDSYVVPKSLPRHSMVPSTQLANYVVAHSEFSSPVNRRNLLSALMVNESGLAGPAAGSDETIEEVDDDAKNPQ